MQKNFIFLNKRFEISQHYIQLLLTVFIAAIFAKGTIIFRGYVTDDILILAVQKVQTYGGYYGQGRYGVAFVFWIFNILGINASDMHFPLGIAVLFLHAVLVVSILRFVGMEKSWSAAVAGAIMIAHPYLVEILTFQLMFPVMCLVLIFCIIVLEMLIRDVMAWKTRILALLAMLGMLFTYQIYLSYIAVAIVFAFLSGQILHNRNDQALTTKNIYRERAIALTTISVISAVVFMIALRLTKTFGITLDAGRSQIISSDEIPARIELILTTLKRIYWFSEPIFPDILKIPVAIMLIMSVIIIFWYLLTQKGKENLIKNVFLVIPAILLLLPISLGVNVFFTGWWPASRIISQVAIIIGLTFLMADNCIKNSNTAFLKPISCLFFASEILVLVGFVLLNNQILADQQRLNQWDKMMANRIITRLETHPNFDKINFIYISDGSGEFYYPPRLRTNMHMSGFTYGGSDIRVALLLEFTGYNFSSQLNPIQITIAETYCATKKPWPHTESVTIDKDLAIICLKK